MTTATTTTRSVGNIDRCIEHAQIASDAVAALRAAGADPGEALEFAAKPLGDLMREREAAVERDRLAFEREERERAEKALMSEGHALIDAISRRREYEDDCARCGREQTTLRERYEALRLLEPVRRYIESDRVAMQYGVGAAWCDGGVKTWLVSGRPRDQVRPPAAWLTFRDANVASTPGDHQRAYAAWPAALRWDEGERAVVVEYASLGDVLANAQRASDDALRRLEELEARFPALRITTRT